MLRLQSKNSYRSKRSDQSTAAHNNSTVSHCHPPSLAALYTANNLSFSCPIPMIHHLRCCFAVAVALHLLFPSLSMPRCLCLFLFSRQNHLFHPWGVPILLQEYYVFGEIIAATSQWWLWAWFSLLF